MLWLESAGNVAVTAAVPEVEAVKVELQVAVAPVPDRLQAVNDPVTPVSASVTVPVGVIAVPRELSVTVTEQAEPWLMTTGEAHEIAVVVVRGFTVMLVVPLVPW